MKLTLTFEADNVNIQALNVRRAVVDADDISSTELNDKITEDGRSLRVADAPRQQTTDSPPPFTTLTDIRSLQYRTCYGKG